MGAGLPAGESAVSDIELKPRAPHSALPTAAQSELDELKARFMREVSHELRTPVAAIGLYLNLLERACPEKQAEYIGVLKEQTHLLTHLVEEVLDFAALAREPAVGYLVTVDVNELAQRVVERHRPAAQRAGLALHFDPDPAAPAVRGDPARLAQAVGHLLENALTYTLAGEVRVRTRRAGAEAVLEVRDTGVGVDPADRPYIFDSFYRSRRSDELNLPGNGLGLAAAQRIAERHGGAVEMESEPGRGSTFRLRLPEFKN